MSFPRSVRYAVAGFRLLEGLLPRRIRERHGDEMEALLTELLVEAHARGGPVAVFGAWLRSCVDMVFSGDLERAPGRSRHALRRERYLEALLQDVRLSVRHMRARPGVSLITVGSLTVGIGATVAIFTFADTILWKPWSFHEPERVVQIFERQDRYLLPSWQTFRAVEDNVDVLDGVLASHLDLFALGAEGSPRTVAGERVSGAYFRVLGLPALLGRYPAPEDRSAGPLPVVLSHHLWTTDHGADRSIIGRSVRLNGHPATVVAVAPPALTGTKWGVNADLWVPMRAWAEADGWTDWEDDRGLVVTVMGRMGPGVDPTAVDAALSSLAAGIRESRPGTPAHFSLHATDRLRGDMGPEIGVLADVIALTAILAGVLVLLVGCGNVASLLLARGVLRSREVAVRHALGASRGRIVRQLIAENVLLVAAATVLGLALSTYAGDALVGLLPTFDFRVDFQTAPGPRSIAFAVVLSVLTVLACGLAPALQLARTNPAASIKTDGGERISFGRTRLLETVVVGMVAGTVLTLFVAGTFGRTLASHRTAHPGFSTENRIMAVVPLRLAGHGWREATTLFEDLERGLASLPGVASVGYGSGIPLGESWSTLQVFDADRAYGQDEPGIRSFRSSVSDAYFEAMGTRIVRGRPFDIADAAEGPWVAVVNEELAERMWPGQDPIGRQVRFGVDPDAEPVEVVGVAETGMYFQVGESPQPAVFASFRQWPQSQALVVLETTTQPLELVPAMRAVLAAIDPDVPLQRVRTAEVHYRWALWLHRLGAAIGATVSVLALMMSGAGLYGVMSFTLRARRYEMGIRRALGAGRASVVGLGLRGSLRLTALGLGIGVLLSSAAGAALAAAIAGVDPWDPVVIAAVGLFVMAVGSGSALPATLSAARVDPLSALRPEP